MTAEGTPPDSKMSTPPVWLVYLILSVLLVAVQKSTAGHVDRWIEVSLLVLASSLGVIQALGYGLLLTLEIVTPLVLIWGQPQSQGRELRLSSGMWLPLIRSWASDAVLVASGLGSVP